MALIVCPECGHKVSDKAEVCPECGFPLDKKQKNNQLILHTGRKVNYKDPSWLREAADSFNHKTNTMFTAAFILLAVGILFLIIFLCDTYIDESYTYITVVEHKDGYLPVIFIAFLGFILFMIFAVTRKITGSFVVDNYNDYVIAIECHGKQKLFVNGVETIYEPHYHTEICGDEDGTTSTQVLDRATAILPDKTKLSIIIGKENIFKYEPKGTYKDTTTEVYVVNNVKKKNSASKSDMEKILIKNAKIDALASIDPTNTEKSKEHIKIYKELDDLGD